MRTGVRSARRSASADAAAIVVVAAKYTQIATAFRSPRRRRLARCPTSCWSSSRIRPKAPTPYRTAMHGLGQRADRAAGTAARRADRGRVRLVTVNSTAAIEAMPLGVPALVVRLPNNLTPFVEAGVMAGAATDAAIEPALERCCMMERCAAGWPRPVARSSPATASTPTAGPHGERPTSFSSSPDTEFRACIHHRRRRVHRVAPGRGAAGRGP